MSVIELIGYRATARYPALKALFDQGDVKPISVSMRIRRANATVNGTPSTQRRKLWNSDRKDIPWEEFKGWVFRPERRDVCILTRLGIFLYVQTPREQD